MIGTRGDEKKSIEEFIKNDKIDDAVKVATDELEVFDAYQKEIRSKRNL